MINLLTQEIYHKLSPPRGWDDCTLVPTYASAAMWTGITGAWRTLFGMRMTTSLGSRDSSFI